MPRKKLIAANCKMNPVPAEALEKKSVYHSTTPTVVVFPMITEIEKCLRAGLTVGAQCGHARDAGAFTGDVSMAVLPNLGCSYVLCGHSERRQYHGETDAMVAEQALSALAHKLIPIVCIGETDSERGAGKTKDILTKQLQALLSRKPAITQQNCLIAYEPVWAIGSGKTPTTSEVEEMHAFIRSMLPDTDIRILYGGSVNGTNAKELLSCPNVDGGIIGGATLKPEEFRKIVEAAVDAM